MKKMLQNVPAQWANKFPLRGDRLEKHFLLRGTNNERKVNGYLQWSSVMYCANKRAKVQ